MKIMVAYDGTRRAKEALAYGIEKARQKGGEVVALHVFDPALFLDYDATPDAENVARAEAARFIDEAKQIIAEKGKGMAASLYSTDGRPEDEVVRFARSEKADVLLCPPKFKRLISKCRRAAAESGLAGEAAAHDLAAITMAAGTR